MLMLHIFQMLVDYLATNSIVIITGDFYYDLLKVFKKKLLDNFIDHVQIVMRQHVCMDH